MGIIYYFWSKYLNLNHGKIYPSRVNDTLLFTRIISPNKLQIKNSNSMEIYKLSEFGALVQNCNLDCACTTWINSHPSYHIIELALFMLYLLQIYLHVQYLNMHHSQKQEWTRSWSVCQHISTWGEWDAVLQSTWYWYCGLWYWHRPCGWKWSMCGRHVQWLETSSLRRWDSGSSLLEKSRYVQVYIKRDLHFLGQLDIIISWIWMNGY